MDFSAYKFRASGVGNLMVEPRSKSEVLSETAKSYLLEVYIKERFGREKILANKYLDKGNFVEEDSLTLVTSQTKDLLIKNKKRLENEFISGTPDVVKPYVLDIKSSWDLFTFTKADGNNKLYYWQLQAYMWLTGREKAKLAYCLVNSPDHQIYQEKRRAMYSLNLADEEGTPEFDAMEKQVEMLMTFDDIPAEMRLKVFDFDFDPEGIEKLQHKVKFAREYLAQLDEKGL